MFFLQKTDDSLFAQFFFADEKLNTVAHKLECYNNRKDVDQCQSLINQLKICQDRVLTVVQQIIADVNPHGCASRDFRVKFPDDIVQENFAGLLWFGAEVKRSVFVIGCLYVQHMYVSD